MEMRGIKNIIYSLAWIASLCGCISEDANDVRIQERPWSEVCDWLSSGEDFTQDELLRVYDCSVDGGKGGSIMVSFLPSFGATTVASGDGITLYCDNTSTNVLSVAGFPPCCKGISIKGRFDLSQAKVGNSVEYYFQQNAECGEVDQIKMVPDFSSASEIKYLEMALLAGEYNDWHKVPVLDASLFAGHDKLEELHLDIGGLLSHTETLLQCKELRNIQVNSCCRIAYGEVAVDNMGPGEDSDDGPEDAARECYVDDSSFDEFIKCDFSKLGRLDVRIKLSKIRVWDISCLANLKLEELYIVSENCLITGMESLRRSKGLSDVSILMKVQRWMASDYAVEGDL